MHKGAADAQYIDSPVGFEALVFNRDDGLAEDGGKTVVADHLAAFQRKRADDAALSVVKVGQGGGAVMLQLVDLGQIDRVDQGEAGQGAGDDCQHQQNSERRATGELTAPLHGSPRHTE